MTKIMDLLVKLVSHLSCAQMIFLWLYLKEDHMIIFSWWGIELHENYRFANFIYYVYFSES